MTMLHQAVACEDEVTVYNCLLRGDDPDEPHWDTGGNPPILIAAAQSNPDIIRYLCEAGCDVNVRNVCGESALHLVIASKKNVYSSINVLLDYGCDCKIQEKLRGSTALHTLTKHISLATDLSPEAMSILHRLTCLSIPCPPDHRGRTPLHYAVLYNASVKQLEVLMSCGVNDQNVRGETALHELIESEDKFILINTLSKTTDLSLRNSYGETPLHVSARKGYKDIVKLLLKQGSDPNIQDLKGNTPLHLAAERGFTEIVETLAHFSSTKLNQRNNEGLTPLHVAVESSFPSAVQILLKAENCDLGAKNKKFQTALDIAQEEYRVRTHPELESILQEEIVRRYKMCSR